jgi:hypothetical protein
MQSFNKLHLCNTNGETMKKLFAVLFIISTIYGQQRSHDLNTLIANEYAFSSVAGQVGSRDAFLEFITNDGILFRPGPVNGKKILKESKPSSGILFWYPTDAFVARAGDLGYTTGPWEWRKNKSDSSAIAFGNFCTVWQKQPNNSWKFLIDIGNSNPKPAVAPAPLRFDESDTAKVQGLIRGERHIKPDELIKLDNQFTEIVAKMGVAQTYQKFITESSKILKDGSAPIIGVWSIIDFLSQRGLHYKFSPLGGKISASNDFGYTYGELAITREDPPINEKYNYLRIWQREEKHWTLAVEVESKVEK